MAFTPDGVDNLKELIAIHKDDPSILAERRKALDAAMTPTTEQPDQA
jgi:hypothetical protein